MPTPTVTTSRQMKLELMKYNDKQLALARDIIDRWFGYYLLIIGAPIPVIAALLKLDLFQNSSSDDLREFVIGLGIVSLFYFFLGLHFLSLHTTQRIVVIRFSGRINPSETALRNFAHDITTRETFTIGRFGSDFWAGAVLIFINSVWVTSALACLYSLKTKIVSVAHVETADWILLFVVLIISIMLQHFLRQVRLWKFEGPSDRQKQKRKSRRATYRKKFKNLKQKVKELERPKAENDKPASS